jgi:hypothetical protein
VKFLVQQPQRKRGIGTAATQAAAHWYGFVQMNSNGGQKRECFFQQLVRFHTTVAPSITAFDSGGKQGCRRVRRFDNFQYIMQGNRVEAGLQVVKTIRPLAGYIKPEVDFAIGKKNHGESG